MNSSSEHSSLPLATIIADRMTELLATWPKEVTLDNVAVVRSVSDAMYPATAEEHAADRPVHALDRQVLRGDGTATIIACYYPRVRPDPCSALLYLHSGGLVSGNRFTEDLGLLDLAADTGSAVVSVEYRLAPEHPYPAAIDDGLAVWVWLLENAADLGIDPEQIVLVGESAGGGLAAALALLIRDGGGLQPCGQLLATPMLDHRNSAVSVTLQDGVGLWDRVSNETGWAAYLGALANTNDVPEYASASMARNLAGLPPAFLDVADAEIFRDEVVDFASRLWRGGVPAELHVVTGGCHQFYALIPNLPLARTVYGARVEWLQRLLHGIDRINDSCDTTPDTR